MNKNYNGGGSIFVQDYSKNGFEFRLYLTTFSIFSEAGSKLQINISL